MESRLHVYEIEELKRLNVEGGNGPCQKCAMREKQQDLRPAPQKPARRPSRREDSRNPVPSTTDSDSQAPSGSESARTTTTGGDTDGDGVSPRRGRRPSHEGGKKRQLRRKDLEVGLDGMLDDMEKIGDRIQVSDDDI